MALPARLSAPKLPELNYSRVSVVQSVLQAPLSLIQGARHARAAAESPYGSGSGSGRGSGKVARVKPFARFHPAELSIGSADYTLHRRASPALGSARCGSVGSAHDDAAS